jgi:hypothetical protein
MSLGALACVAWGVLSARQHVAACSFAASWLAIDLPPARSPRRAPRARKSASSRGAAAV